MYESVYVCDDISVCRYEVYTEKRECVDRCKDDISECVWTHCINEVLYITLNVVSQLPSRIVEKFYELFILFVCVCTHKYG